MKKTVFTAAALALAMIFAIPAGDISVSAEKISAAQAYQADKSCTANEKAVTEKMLQDPKAKEYYNAITADMSWYNSKTKFFTILDVTGDGVPELIVTEDQGYARNTEKVMDYRIKTVCKFYSLKSGKPKHMYDADVGSALTSTKDEKGNQCWCYRTVSSTCDPKGNYEYREEFGTVQFGEKKCSKTVKFSAYEKSDPKKDTLEYCYKNNGKVMYDKAVKNYSRRRKDTEKTLSDNKQKWFTAADKWISSCYKKGVCSNLCAGSAEYTESLLGYGLYYTPLGKDFKPYKGADGKSVKGETLYGISGYLKQGKNNSNNNSKHSLTRKGKNSSLLKMNIAELCDAYSRGADVLKG